MRYQAILLHGAAQPEHKSTARALRKTAHDTLMQAIRALALVRSEFTDDNGMIVLFLFFVFGICLRT